MRFSPLRFPQSPHARPLWRHAHSDAQFRSAGGAKRRLRQALCRLAALHAGAARLLTGRLTFLHRSWGPLEPFDNAFPELLRATGVYTHLVTDHYHYWEDGGATYHNRYDTFEFVRGQESDPWKAMVQPPWERLREMYHERQFDTERRGKYRHNIVNREFIREEKDFPSVQCFARGLEFLDLNRDADNWLLQIETFDPHEPFFAPDRFKEPFKTGWNGPIRDWPRYGRVDELPEEARSCAPTTTPSSPSATICSASCSTISTRTTCGRTPRSS